MKKILIVATLDIRYYPNNRIHHIIDRMRTKFEEVVVLYKAVIPPQTSRMKQWRAFFSLNIEVTRQDNVMWLRVDPLFNRVDGLGLTLLSLHGPDEIPLSRFRRAVRRIFSFFGLFIELAVPVSFLWAYFRKVRGSFDVFLGQGPLEMICGLFLKRLGKVSLLVYDDFDYIPGLQLISTWRAKYTAWLEAALLRKSDLIISVGSLLADMRRRQTDKPIFVVPNGVQYDLLQQAQKKMPHPPTLFYMGYVSWWSGLDLVVQALSRLLQEIPDLRLIVAGHTSHNYLDHLLQVIQELHLEKHFQHVGSMAQKDLIPYLRVSDVGLAVFRPVELRKYAFPLKVIEYMTAGLPVIVTQNTQAAKIIEDHRTGATVPHQVEAIAQATLSLLTHQEQYALFVQNAIRASREYDWNVLMEKQYKLIQWSFHQSLSKE